MSSIRQRGYIFSGNSGDFNFITFSRLIGTMTCDFKRYCKISITLNPKRAGRNVVFFLVSRLTANGSVPIYVVFYSTHLKTAILYLSNTKYKVMQPTYNIIQNTKNPPLLKFFPSDSRSLFAMYVDSSIGTSTSWMILTSKGLR